MVTAGWVIQTALGFLGGLVASFLYDRLKAPNLDIDSSASLAFQLEAPPKTYNAYRLKVRNKEKPWLNAAAQNCTAWLELDGAFEQYQLSWVGAKDALTINVGDQREFDLCGREVGSGRIVAPTERGYFNNEPRIVGDGKGTLRGKVRVTCSNGRRVERGLTITPSNGGALSIQLLKPSPSLSPAYFNWTEGTLWLLFAFILVGTTRGAFDPLGHYLFTIPLWVFRALSVVAGVLAISYGVAIFSKTVADWLCRLMGTKWPTAIVGGLVRPLVFTAGWIGALNRAPPWLDNWIVLAGFVWLIMYLVAICLPLLARKRS